MIKKHFKKRLVQLISLDDKPHDIAFGLAIGVFIGATPTIPFHTVLILLTCFFIKKNIPAGLIGSWLISNPLTIPILYVTQYRFGKYLLSNHYSDFAPEGYSLICLIQRGCDFIVPLLIGGIIMAPLFAIPSYFIIRKLITAVRKHKDGHSKEHH